MGFIALPGSRRVNKAKYIDFESLERRSLLASAAAPDPVLTSSEVATLLDRAARLTPGDNAIVAIVDREGNPLGIRVEGNVSTAITGNTEKLVFAVDGALAEARTGAFFANNQAPLTSRTVQQISQSTIIQREVNSDPNITDPNSPLAGPGLVAPIGQKGHFPPRVMFTPQVDLAQIELTNRDSLIHSAADGNRTAADHIILPNRFNVPTKDIPPGQAIPAPESYGAISGLLPYAQSRGIGTLPGGVPISDGKLVGGIGVFFPGMTGFASEENSALNDAGLYDPKKPDLANVAEYVAFAAVGGSKAADLPTNTTAVNAKLGLEPLPGGFTEPFGRIDLVGISLDIFGAGGLQGPRDVAALGQRLPLGDAMSGINLPVTKPPKASQTLLGGTDVPTGWIVTPHDSADGTLTAADVIEMVDRGIAEANRVRAAIRLPLNSTAKMIFAVTDKDGNVLGLYRMPDATYFSFDVAVAKARNVAYYANPQQLQPIDKLPSVPAGTAFTNRTFRYLAEPHFPEGIDYLGPGPFSILQNDTVRETGTPKPVSAFQSAVGYTAFHPDSNFHDPYNTANQDGVVFFPGSAPLYKTVNGVKQLVGGLGVSGDGVDQDDDVTFQATVGFTPPPTVLTADETFYKGVRLPYQKFNRQPHVPVGGTPSEPMHLTPPLPNGQQTGPAPADVQRIENFNQQANRVAAQQAAHQAK